MADLSNSQIRYLREQAHHLDAIVRIGDAGVSEGILKEIDKVLGHHELIKIKIPAGDKSEKQTLIEEICKACRAVSVQSIGNVAVLYRANPEEPKIILPK